jgi:predicted dehydrogenase
VTAFRTIPADEPLRVALVGAGSMGRSWLDTVRASPDVALACVVEIRPELARQALADLGIAGVPVFETLDAAAVAVPVRAVVDVTVPEAHLPVTLAALALGLPVLGEKPAAATLAEAQTLAAAAQESGELFMVSQSRRYDGRLRGLAAALPTLGEVGIVSTRFARAPRFGGFRERMAHPLLLDMAIHAFDAARLLIGTDPVAVSCEEFNPAWSWYDGAAAATATFEFAGGARYHYAGSWCSPGREMSWNGEWSVSASGGSAEWDGDHPAVLYPGGPCPVDDGPEGTAGALAAFVHALRTGVPPEGEISDNVKTLAMVFAAIESATAGRRVLLADLLG